MRPCFALPVFLSLSLLSAFALGCSGGSHPATTPAYEPAPAASTIIPTAGGAHLAIRYQLELDQASMTALIRPIDERSAAASPQGKRYDLDIEKFLMPTSLTVESFHREDNGDLHLVLHHAHPFPAPDVVEPPTGINRADLSYTGRLLVLADLDAGKVPANTYFGDVIANTQLVIGAQGYLQAGDLLHLNGFNTNTFPYILLADDGQDNRLDKVSNEGVPTGNYDPLLGGWQVHNIGSPAIEWTGYDFLHAGQRTRNHLVLDQDALTGQTVQLEIALFIQYTDPRGATGKLRRLPQDPFDLLAFAYRLPYAALDCSVIRSEGITRVDETQFAVGAVNFVVRDWDAQAEEGTDADLSDEPNIALVQPGASGFANARIHCPVLDPTPGAIIPAGGTSGYPDDEVFYSGGLTNELGTAAPGSYTAMIELTDPEATDIDRGTYHAGVDPVTIIPDPARAIPAITYQALTVQVRPVIAPPTWQSHFAGPAVGLYPELDRSGIVSYDGTLAVVYNQGNMTLLDPDAELWLARSIGASPATATDWVLSPIATDGNAGQFVTLMETGDRLMAAYLRFYDASFVQVEDLEIALATTATPNGVGDWTRYTLESVGSTGRDAKLGMLGGLPAISYQNDTAWLRFAIANTTLPTSAANWTITTPDTYPQAGYLTDWVEWNGGPVVVHRAFQNGDVRIARANTLTPSINGVWTSAVLSAGQGWMADWRAANPALAVSAGRLAVAYTDYNAKQAYVGLHDGNDDLFNNWQWQTIADTGDSAGGCDLLDQDDRLLLLLHVDINTIPFESQTLLRAYRAVTPDPVDAADWDSLNVDAGGPFRQVGIQPVGIIHNNEYWISYGATWPAPTWPIGVGVARSDGLW